jgi:hypothetical protein
MSMDEVLHRLTSIDMTDTSISFMMYKVETLNDYTVGHPYQEVLVASQGDCRHGLLKGHTYLLEGVNRRFNFLCGFGLNKCGIKLAFNVSSIRPK